MCVEVALLCDKASLFLVASLMYVPPKAETCSPFSTSPAGMHTVLHNNHFDGNEVLAHGGFDGISLLAGKHFFPGTGWLFVFLLLRIICC